MVLGFFQELIPTNMETTRLRTHGPLKNCHPFIQLDANMDATAYLNSDPICSSAGCTQYKHKKKALGYKIDYGVPNFGRDNDINDNFESLKTAEGMIGHEFQIGTD